ncbi:enoyl-CoA hydratase [Bordetella genomosp. 5]|uniref:enoyl-CoA hydratase-related protein n=1 Tax=Bordetella genomosp. 5 TaxID=1395608 RepID=UPI000B9E6457|nr:enoyl-CoA hydratase-related protein [Bordetella genomosp. 5]OZI47434.1 enoyl-CoA hydratase [Bordetella genomosp. 5]
MSAPVLQARDGAILTLTINRPEARNALDRAAYDALTQGLTDAAADPGVAAVILTGAGGHFTAGNDLRDFQADRPEGDSPALRFLRALIDLDTPVIAAVEGNAVGVGVTLLQHCDFVYVAEGAVLRLPFAALGLCPEGGSSLLLPQIAGVRQATEWLLLGEKFGAQAAHEHGLANAVVPAGGALARARETAQLLAAQPHEALRVSKALLKRALRPQLHATLDEEAKQFRARLRSDEAQAAFARFFAARKG